MIGISFENLGHVFILHKIDSVVYIIDSYINYRKAEIREFNHWEYVLRTVLSKDFNFGWCNQVFNANVNGNEMPKDKILNHYELIYHAKKRGTIFNGKKIVIAP